MAFKVGDKIKATAKPTPEGSEFVDGKPTFAEVDTTKFSDVVMADDGLSFTATVLAKGGSISASYAGQTDTETVDVDAVAATGVDVVVEAVSAPAPAPAPEL
jgi:hypothetical protein